jgi:hypothetical protein
VKSVKVLQFIHLVGVFVEYAIKMRNKTNCQVNYLWL